MCFLLLKNSKMVRKNSAGRAKVGKSSRPVSEEEPVPIQSIDPLAIVVYNPENIPPVTSAISTESDTSDEDQQVEKIQMMKTHLMLLTVRILKRVKKMMKILMMKKFKIWKKTLRLKKIHLIQKQSLKELTWIHLLLKFLPKPRLNLLLVRQNVKRWQKKCTIVVSPKTTFQSGSTSYQAAIITNQK